MYRFDCISFRVSLFIFKSTGVKVEHSKGAKRYCIVSVLDIYGMNKVDLCLYKRLFGIDVY